jgi:hypothetical protein
MVNHLCEPISSNQFASCSLARVGQGGGGAPLTIHQFSHDALPGFAGVSTATNFVASCNFNSINAVRLPATQRCAGGEVSTLHCREISAELTFRNKVNLARTLRTQCAPRDTRRCQRDRPDREAPASNQRAGRTMTAPIRDGKRFPIRDEGLRSRSARMV